MKKGLKISLIVLGIFILLGCVMACLVKFGVISIRSEECCSCCSDPFETCITVCCPCK